MDEPFYTIAVLKAKAGQFDQLKSILQQLAAETRKETGAIEYFFIEDKTQPETILSYEKWQNTKEEASHWETPHLLSAIDQFKGVLDGEPAIHKGHQII